MNDDDNYDKFKRIESTASDNRRKPLEGEKFNRGYFALNLNIKKFKSSIYFFP